MDPQTFLPNNLTECARVYIYFTQENTNFFIINCLYCNKDFAEWIQFYKHLLGHYTENIELEQSETKEYKENIQLEKCNQNSGKKCEIKSEYLVKNETLDNVGEECENKEEFLEEYLMEYYEECKKRSTNGEDFITKKSSSKPVINTCFFRLSTTDSKLMLQFIELLRQHPCQWDHKHHNFNLKDKRIVSTLNLTKQLKKDLNLNITAQGTRSSVLALLRWFDREYIRFLNCQQNDFKFVCVHREYFEKLMEFLPYQHLKPVKCEECDKRFKTEHLLLAHKHKQHNGQVPFRCRYCGHGFIHQSSHKMHENRHIKLHVWPCSNCLYQASSKSDYIKHLATHSSRQPYKCNICGLAYKTKTNLNVHLKSHSLPAYECEFCKKKFYEKYRYKRHIWLHEEQEMSGGKSVDNFTCEICGRRFTSYKTLRKHQLVHIQENYKTDESMAKNDAFKLIDVIMYYCDYCSLEFIHKEAYETHMKLKHNIKKM
ncbi:zinc finger protein 23 [Lucilia sericata]|uniref:zinc finger protein 23 n=1 Tax=Lucilia sericata TaxID=13632 RepID=UPI0018A85BA7|nr:zinc finger protein 23 [Lucilia sericata]